jgi:hypothetical protein
MKFKEEVVLCFCFRPSYRLFNKIIKKLSFLRFSIRNSFNFSRFHSISLLFNK